MKLKEPGKPTLKAADIFAFLKPSRLVVYSLGHPNNIFRRERGQRENHRGETRQPRRPRGCT